MGNLINTDEFRYIFGHEEPPKPKKTKSSEDLKRDVEEYLAKGKKIEFCKIQRREVKTIPYIEYMKGRNQR